MRGFKYLFKPLLEKVALIDDASRWHLSGRNMRLSEWGSARLDYFHLYTEGGAPGISARDMSRSRVVFRFKKGRHSGWDVIRETEDLRPSKTRPATEQESEVLDHLWNTYSPNVLHA